MPCYQGEQRVIAAAAHPIARVEMSTALPDDDFASIDQLAAEPLDSEPLSVGVPTITRRRRAFLVCHILASALDISDLDRGVPLAMTLTLAVAGLVLELQDADLRTLCFTQHFGGH
jgi:hypothetical protein